MNESDKLPPGWKWVRLGEVCEMITDGTHQTPYYVKEGIPFLSVKNVKEFGLDFENVQYISIEEHKKLIERCYPRKGDVLYTKVGTTGIAKAIDIEKEFSIFVSVALLRPNRTIIIPEYLEKVLNSPFCKEQAKALTQGVGNQNLVIKDLKKIEFPLPPLEEQHRIAEKLQELMQDVERARNACEKQLEAVKVLPSAYLREVFESEEAKKWERKRLGEVCEFLDHKRIPVNEEDRQRRIVGKQQSELYPYYGANGQIGWIDSYIFDEELVLLAEDGGFFGSHEKPIAYRVSGKCWVNNHAHVLRPRNNVDIEWLHFSLRIRPDVGDMVTGSTRPKLNQEVAAQIPTHFPPLETQRRIASELKEKMAYVENLQSAIRNQQSALKALPQAILRKAFRGEL